MLETLTQILRFRNIAQPKTPDPNRSCKWYLRQAKEVSSRSVTRVQPLSVGRVEAGNTN